MFLEAIFFSNENVLKMGNKNVIKQSINFPIFNSLGIILIPFACLESFDCGGLGLIYL